MSLTSVIQAAGPSVVALAAIGSTLWQQRRGFMHAREMADLAAVRTALDDAALALQRIGTLPGNTKKEHQDRIWGSRRSV